MTKRARPIRWKVFLFSFVLTLSGHATFGSLAQTPPLKLDSLFPYLSRERDFDGIDFPKYAKFWESWHLVTVRFRSDTNEQRFIYANDLAYRALKSNAREFPDGAMFGKIGFGVEKDDAFPASLAPKSFKRIQLMEKSAKKHPGTNGWGYAIYLSGEGVPYATMKTTVEACHACHQIVADRDFVFSKSAFDPSPTAAGGNQFENLFVKKSFSSLDEAEKKALQATGITVSPAVQIKVLHLALFPGSVNESVPSLIDYVRKNKMPFLLIDLKSGYFLSAAPAQKSSCPDEVKLARSVDLFLKGKAKMQIDRGTACASTVTWSLNWL